MRRPQSNKNTKEEDILFGEVDTYLQQNIVHHHSGFPEFM